MQKSAKIRPSKVVLVEINVHINVHNVLKIL